HNKIFLFGAIFTFACVCLHIYTMEVWIYPKLKDDCFPTTPFGDSTQTKKSFRMLWHFFTINFFSTIIAELIMAFSDWISDPVLLGRFIALHWFAWTLVAFWIAQFQPKQLIHAFQWVLLVLIGAIA